MTVYSIVRQVRELREKCGSQMGQALRGCLSEERIVHAARTCTTRCFRQRFFPPLDDPVGVHGTGA
jgi:hypothetical protein